MKCNYYLTDSVDPYRNLSIEQELMKIVKKDTYIIFLWQNKNTIVVGRNQDIQLECKEKEFVNSGGKIARRRSGGGAVFHDLGNLNFSIICFEKCVSNCRYYNIISNALKEFDIKVDFNGRNDIVYKEKKFSGNAAYVDNEVSCQHGTLLVSTNLDKMDYYLTPEESKLKRNHVSSVRSRVINLNSISDRINIESMKKALIDSNDAKELHFEMDENKIKEQESFYRSYEWLHGGIR